MTEGVWIALIAVVPVMVVATGGIIVPLLNKRADNKVRQQERAEDRAALKEAADKAAEVAREAKEVSRVLAMNTAQTTAATKALTDKVDVVHVLVNSNLTLATQKLRDRSKRALSLLIQHSPTNSTEINAIKLEIADLDAVLADRRKQAIAVEKLQDKQRDN